MAESIVSELVGRLLGFLTQSASAKFASYFGGRDNLKQLEDTMMMIQARLLDAERVRDGEDGALIKLWIKRLKNVLYRFEDLYGEVSFADKEMEQMAAKSLTKLVCFPVPNLQILKMNKRVAHDAKSIMRELEGITSDMHKLYLRVHSPECQSSMNVMNSRETHSYVLQEEIIGRDENRNDIVNMLVDCDPIGEDLSVIPIVGIGGLGKTALAQLVYSDIKVQQEFELKAWVCISEISSFEELAGKILKSLVRRDCSQLSTDQLQSCLQESVNGKKYLLVLDDVWDEDRERWLSLRRLLCCGKRGSKIIVTSRSEVVALNMGTVKPYQLKGLSEKDSWVLFRSLAFRGGQEGRNPNLISIGEEIVKRCANVPLAIRTTAGVLYSKYTEEEWLHFRDSDHRLMEKKENSIMSTLKLSYDHLSPQLKQCFSYCALFPKDHEFDKQKLIWLWMSQGFLDPFGRNHGMEDVGHAYFLELLRRCFFQDVRRNIYGSITHFKMHDLMHDLAVLVADECLLVDKNVKHVNDNVKHMHFITVTNSLRKPPSWSLAVPPIRSHLLSINLPGMLTINKSISRFVFLRALDMGEGMYESLPNSIGELKHLRYLRVCVLSICLPIGITRLLNLQTLDLRNSWRLRELPRGFDKLRSLRSLQLLCPDRVWLAGITINEIMFADSGRLVDMSTRFGKLTSLQTLDKFIVGKNNGLDALSSMNLAGELQIFFKKQRQDMKTEAMLASLKEKKLTALTLKWFFTEELDTSATEVLECLHPPATLKAFTIQDWKGVRFPSWGIDQIPCKLPNLVSITIEGCIRCQYLPPFSQLPYLKVFHLRALHSLEYIETETRASNIVSSPSRTSYFPALERLSLWDLPKLKGWLNIEHPIDSTSSQVTSAAPIVSKKLHLTLGRLLQLESLPTRFSCFTMLQVLHLLELPNLKSIPEWIGCFSQLRKLFIEDCPKITALPVSFRTLTSLQELWIVECPELMRRCNRPDGEDWPLIQHVLVYFN